MIMLGVADPNRTEDTFRVRLVVALLDVSAPVLCASKSGAERLSIFCIYFQRYVLALKHVPLDLHFAMNDCLERVPTQIRRLRSLEEATQAIRVLEGNSNQICALTLHSHGFDRSSRGRP